MDGNAILTIVASCTALFLAGGNACIWIIVKFNDLKHQEDSLRRIEAVLANMDQKHDRSIERISLIEGKCIANHRI